MTIQDRQPASRTGYDEEADSHPAENRLLNVKASVVAC